MFTRKKTRMLLGAVLVLGLVCGFSSYVLSAEEGLVAYWPMNEGEGTIVRDRSGNGNDGTVHGAKWEDSEFGHVLRFNGIDNYVEVQDSESLNPADSITIETWVCFNVLGKGVSTFVSKGSEGANTLYWLMAGNGDRLGFTVGDGTCRNQAVKWINLSTGRWYHVVATFDNLLKPGVNDGSGKFCIYVNGKMSENTSAENPPVTGIKTAGYPLTIGAHKSGTRVMHLLGGMLRDIKIYNRALSAKEIREHYGKGLKPVEEGTAQNTKTPPEPRKIVKSPVELPVAVKEEKSKPVDKQTVWIRLGSVNEENGIRLIDKPDGKTEAEVIKGKECRRMSKGTGATSYGGRKKSQQLRYMHFEIDEGFSILPEDEVVMIVEYFDLGIDVVYFFNGPVSTVKVIKDDDRIWKKKIYGPIKGDVFLKNYFNRGKEFRFYNHFTGEEYISYVEVKILSKEEKSLAKEVREELFLISRDYSKLIVRQAKIEDLVYQLKRAVFYSKGDLIAPSSLSMLENKIAEKIKSIQDPLYNIAKYTTSFIIEGRKNELNEKLANVSTLITSANHDLDSLGKITLDEINEARKYSLKKNRYLTGLKMDTFSFNGSEDPKKEFEQRIWFGLRYGLSKFLREDVGIDFRKFTLSWVLHKEYDFSNADSYIKDCEKKGLKAVIAFTGFPTPRWFLNKYKNKGFVDNELFGSLGGHSNKVWFPPYKELREDFVKRLGERYRDNQTVLAYMLYGEEDIGLGYGDPFAAESFRQYLKEKFGSIKNLNKKLNVSYKTFEEIETPGNPIKAKIVRLNPLLYEFEQFRIESLYRFIESSIKVLKKADPNHPVMSQLSFFANKNVIDALKMQSAGWDVFCGPSYPHRDGRHNYCLNRYINLPLLWMYEPYWANPESFRYSDRKYEHEVIVKTAARRNFWQFYAWGVRGLAIFDYLQDWHCEVVHGSALRYAASIIPVMKEKGEKFSKLLLETKIVKPKVAILQSVTSSILQFPFRTVLNETTKLDSFLRGTNYQFFYIQAQCITDGRENVYDYDVIIAPYCIHLLPEAKGKLLKWVKKGGMLIASGPIGAFDHYGRDEDSLIRKVFGIQKIVYSPDKCDKVGILSDCQGIISNFTGTSVKIDRDHFWHIESMKKKSNVEILAKFSDGTPAVLNAKHGKGNIIMSTFLMGSIAKFRGLILKELDSKILVKEADASKGNLELVMREDKRGERYLIIINENSSGGRLETTIKVAGEYRNLIDLGIDKGIAIPYEVKSGFTLFDIALYSGEGTIVKLGRSISEFPQGEEAQEAFWKINVLSRAVDEAKEMGIEIGKYAKILQKAQLLFEKKRYRNVLKIVGDRAEEVRKMKVNASIKKLKNLITEAEKDKEKRLSAVRAKNWLNVASLYKEQEDYQHTLWCLEKVEFYLGGLSSPSEKPVQGVILKTEKKIKIDGDLSEWRDVKGEFIPSSNRTWGNCNDDKDSSGTFYLMWDNNYLYLAVKVNDDVMVNNSRGERNWDGDCIEVHLDILDNTKTFGPSYGPDDFKYNLSMNEDVYVSGNTLSTNWEGTLIAVKPSKTGYIMEAAIPNCAIRLSPREGYTITFNLAIMDADKDKVESQITWTDTGGNYQSTKGWRRLVFGNSSYDNSMKFVKKLPEKKTFSSKKLAQNCDSLSYWQVLQDDAREDGSHGLSLNTNSDYIQEGRGSIKIERGSVVEGLLSASMGERKGLSLWIYGDGNNGNAKIELIAPGGDYWQKEILIDFTGWKKITLKKGEGRSLLFFDVEALIVPQVNWPYVNKIGLSLVKPGRYIYVDEIEFIH